MVEGRKVWTRHGHRSRFMLTLCRSATVGEDRRQGLSQVIVHLSTPGVSMRPIRLLGGAHQFNEVKPDLAREWSWGRRPRARMMLDRMTADDQPPPAEMAE